MGKKRSFKRGDDKKGSGSGSGFRSQQPSPGIIIPGDATYIDNRRAPSDFILPTPPLFLTDEEIALETARKEEAELAEVAKKLGKAPGTDKPKPKPKLTDAVPPTRDMGVDMSTSESGQDPHAQKVSDESEVVPANQSDDSDDQPQPPKVDFKQRKSVAELLEEAASDVELEATRRQLLASAWRARDKVYHQLFGKPAYVTPADYREPSVEVPANFGQRAEAVGTDTSNPGDPTMEEQHLAVLAYGPDPQAPYWKYVTAGLASPWVQYEPLQVSGFGCELMVKSPVDAPWAAQFLRTLAFYVFNHAGLLSQGVRLRLNSPIDPASKSELRNAFVWYADEAPDTLYELPSGLFSMLLVAGITDDELEFADSIEEYGTWCIQALLRQAGYGQVTDPSRDSAMHHEDIEAMKTSVRSFADTFRANRAGAFTADDTTFS